MKNNDIKNLREFITECIVVGGNVSGESILGKTRDRNYKPDLKVVRMLTPDGIEIVYLHDMTTDYMEGMNSNGIGVVNAALLVSADEKAADKYWDRSKAGGKKGKSNSNDGPRIIRALHYPKLSQVIKSLIGYDSGLKGHTLVGNPKNLYSIEMTSKHNPIVKKINKNKKPAVRTNHGISHKSAGYTLKGFPNDYVSSKVRKAAAQRAIDDAETTDDIMPSLANQSFKKKSNLNMLRRTDQMRSSSQVMMHLDKNEFSCYIFPYECQFKGIEDNTPKGYKPKIKINIHEYDEDDNLIAEHYDGPVITEKKRKKTKPVRGSQPEDSYTNSTIKNLYLDREIKALPNLSFQKNGKEIPVNVQITNWLKSMKLLE